MNGQTDIYIGATLIASLKNFYFEIVFMALLHLQKLSKWIMLYHRKTDEFNQHSNYLKQTLTVKQDTHNKVITCSINDKNIFS